MRTFTTQDGRFLLNGKPVYLLAALDQDFYPGTIYSCIIQRIPARRVPQGQGAGAQHPALPHQDPRPALPGPGRRNGPAGVGGDSLLADHCSQSQPGRKSPRDPPGAESAGRKNAGRHGPAGFQPPLARHPHDRQRRLGHQSAGERRGPGVGRCAVRPRESHGPVPPGGRQFPLLGAVGAERPRPQRRGRFPLLCRDPGRDAGFHRHGPPVRPPPPVDVQLARRQPAPRRRTAGGFRIRQLGPAGPGRPGRGPEGPGAGLVPGSPVGQLPVGRGDGHPLRGGGAFRTLRAAAASGRATTTLPGLPSGTSTGR